MLEFPSDKDAAREWGEKKKKVAFGMMGAGVSCAGGMIGGIGGGTGNWGGAIGAASGLFCGLFFGGSAVLQKAKQAIAYADGAIEYPFETQILDSEA